MRLQSNILKGTAVSLILSAMAVYPAVAQGQTTTTNQTTTNQMTTSPMMMMGTVQGVYGNVVRIQFNNGQTQDIMFTSDELARLNLRQGSMVSANMMQDGRVTLGMTTATGQPMTTPGSVSIMGQQMVRGTVRSVVGDIVSIQWPNGEVRDYTLMRADIDRLALQGGQDVLLTLGTDNRIGSIDLASNIDQRFATGTTVIGQQTTVTGTTTLPQTTTTVTQPTTTNQPTMTTQQTTVERTTTGTATTGTGVRALW